MIFNVYILLKLLSFLDIIILIIIIYNLCSYIFFIFFLFVVVVFRLIHIPQLAEIFFFVIIVLPSAFIEALKFEDTCKMKKKIINTIVALGLCIIGYLLFSLFKPINCSVIVKYLPSDR